jgi:hypothetical protein
MGTFNPGTGQGGCIPCPRGQFQEETGRSACLLCPPGSFQSRFGNTTCEVCPLGRFALSSGTPECEPCSLGRYADTTNSSQCISCPAGRQQNLQGASTCLICRPVSHLALVTQQHNSSDVLCMVFSGHFFAARLSGVHSVRGQYGGSAARLIGVRRLSKRQSAEQQSDLLRLFPGKLLRVVRQSGVRTGTCTRICLLHAARSLC